MRSFFMVLLVLAACGLPCRTAAADPPGGRGAGGKKPTTLPVPNIVGTKVPRVGVGVGNSGIGTGEIPHDPRVEFEGHLRKANDLYDKGNYYEAMASANSAKLEMTDKEQFERLLGVFAKLNDAGQTQLEAYLKLLEMKEYVKALKGLGVVSRTFTPLPCATAARRALDRAGKDPQIKGAIRELKAQELDATVDQMILTAILPKRGLAGAPASAPGAPPPDAPSDERAKAVRNLAPAQADPIVSQMERLAKSYADTETGKKVAKELAAIRVDGDFFSSLHQYRRDSKASSLLETAAKLSAAGQDEAAERTWRQIIREFPNTTWAQKAKACLPAGSSE